jgi:dihydrofolate reductase
MTTREAVAATYKTPIALIVAVAQNGVIGRDNQLPWRLPGELQHFKATTLGKPIVMGRKTFASLGKALPGRTNIVITRDQSFAAEGAVIAHSLAEALQYADVIAQRDGAGEIMVIGGAEIYRQALPLASTLYYTRVLLDAEGDAHFTDIDWAQWRCSDEQYVAAADAQTPAYRVQRYQRIVGAP